MLDDILVRAALAVVGLSLATGSLGAFVVWRRMAYFGDTIAHAAFLGVALSLVFSVPVFAGTLLVALGVGVLAAGLAAPHRSMDATLGVLSFSALALGLVVVSFADRSDVDLEGLLFGDINTVTATDLTLIWAVSIAVLALLSWRWSRLLTATLNPDIAASVGINPARERLVLTLALAAVVAVSLKIVGAMLIGALLIIPAAAARGLAKSPEAMAAFATLIGITSGLGGIAASALTNAPTGPSIVVVAALIFAVTNWITRSKM